MNIFNCEPLSSYDNILLTALRKTGVVTASTIVIANMIGTGVFTSVGFQLSSLQNTWTILLLWCAGGILALCGALAYAELGAHFKESGGDYIFLSRVFHPLAGYLSAWTGLTVGFSAPVALAGMAISKYLGVFGYQNVLWLPVAIIILIAVMHSFDLKQSSRFHNATTAIKIAFIITLIFAGLLMPPANAGALHFDNSWQHEIFTTGFAVSMIYVSFAYTGWNAAAYITGEIANPNKNLPKALAFSTLFVAVLYVVFQFVLLKHATVGEMKGREEVTGIAFTNVLGIVGGKWVSVFIAIQLVATISSYLWVGARVTWAMAKEHRLWSLLSKQNKSGIPVRAIWAQVLISLVLIFTGSFEKLLLYSGFVLQLMTSITVATSLFIKQKDARAFRTPLKPLPQVIFLAFSAAVLAFTAVSRPTESLLGIGILAVGAAIYFFDKPSGQ